MNNEDAILVLATLEAYRLQAENKKRYSADSDFAIRVCQAIVAKGFGFPSRNEWTDLIVSSGYVRYDIHVDKWGQYEMLSEILEKVCTASEEERASPISQEKMLKAWVSDPELTLEEMYDKCDDEGWTNYNVESIELLEQYIIEHIKQGVNVAPLLASIENNRADYYAFDTRGWSNLPAKPIYTKEELAKALGVRV